MFVINIFERSSFGYVLSNEFVEQFNMGLVCGTIGFGKKDRNTERPLNGSKSHKFRSVIRRYGMQQAHSLEVSQTPINDPSQRFGILAIRQLFNDGIPRLSLGQSKDGFSLLSTDDKIHFCPYGERCIG
nr:hypothetical protein [Porphyromonas endodontalis]